MKSKMFNFIGQCAVVQVCSMVCLCVCDCVSAHHESEPCDNELTERDAGWDVKSWGEAKNHMGTGIPPHGKGHFWGDSNTWASPDLPETILWTLIARGQKRCGVWLPALYSNTCWYGPRGSRPWADMDRAPRASCVPAAVLDPYDWPRNDMSRRTHRQCYWTPCLPRSACRKRVWTSWTSCCYYTVNQKQNKTPNSCP